MPEEEAKQVERLDVSRYFSREFIQNAPVTQGSDALMKWLDENMSTDIQNEVLARYLDPEIRGRHENELKREASMVSQTLWRWANYEHWIKRIAKDPEAKLNFERNTATYPEELREKLRITPEQLRGRQIGIETLISDFGLRDEKQVLKELFDQALAVESEQEHGLTVIEGTVVKRD